MRSVAMLRAMICFDTQLAAFRVEAQQLFMDPVVVVVFEDSSWLNHFAGLTQPGKRRS